MQPGSRHCYLAPQILPAFKSAQTATLIEAMQHRTKPAKAPSLNSSQPPGALDVVRYDVDFSCTHRVCILPGCNGEEYVEAYPAVDVKTNA